MLSGRLGLDDSGVAHKERYPTIYLDRGVLSAFDGGLIFQGADGEITVPVQTVSAIMIGPGSSVTHDALRLLSIYGVCLVATGIDGVRCYTAPPISSARSEVARKHVEVWADPQRRLLVARRMYALRFGELLPHRDLNVLRGIEGARVKAQYSILAKKYGISWNGRIYDRANPQASDDANAAINHASSAVEAAACVAVTALGAIPQLGFIHEDPGQSLVLDIADLYRSDLIIPAAFLGIHEQKKYGNNLERSVRYTIGQMMSKHSTIDKMIKATKALIFEEEVVGGSVIRGLE